ncbi:MAG: MarR family winged helix-turn-helix transcriptional regulator [Bryobacteraceae bacterium]
MTRNRGLREIDDFLGSAHIFASAVTDIIEQRLLEKAAEGQVTASQMKLLKLVAMTDSYTLGDVAAFLRVSNAAASKAVDRLVRRDLLRRTEDQRDRRVMHLHLTRASRRLLAVYENARQRKLQSVFVQFPPEELRHASELLDRLSADIVDHTSNPEELCLKCGIYFRERCLVRKLVPRNCFYQRAQKGVPVAAQTGQPRGEMNNHGKE